MEQIYNMSAENVRQFAYEYLRCSVTSRAIQCLERLKWLGKLRQHEYLLLAMMHARKGNKIGLRHTTKRYNTIFKFNIIK